MQFVASSVFAQQGNLDYYAPGQTSTQLYRNVMLHFPSGRDYASRGQWGSALADYEFILNFYPNHPQALIELSELCVKWKAATCDVTAESWYQKAIARNPGAAQSYVVLALHLHRKKKLDEAVKIYKQAIELAPNSINAHYNLGLAYADLQQYELANLHAQKSYSLGVTLLGLRSRLEKVGKWNPNATLPEPEIKSPAELQPSIAKEKTSE